ncbi:MAG: hypothetical protein JSV04_06405 [Candidatus Heimdallarchaeota archaeon]|nr:MAG: hypothetical protein JSV04_06405 [Candidatus Heimdallarchaeota archaeon]
MNNDNAPVFSVVNLLSLVAAIAGTVFLLFGTGLQYIGGWLLLLGAEIIFWLMLERGIKITRYFGFVSSFILLVATAYVVFGDWTLILERYDFLFLIVYLLFRVLYLFITPGELTFPVLISSTFTVFAGIVLTSIDGSEFIWFIAMAVFICGELLYFWKRDNEETYHRGIGGLSFGIIFLLLLLIFTPLKNTPEFRLDLFLILIYTPFRFFESILPRESTKARTIAFQLSYSLLGFGLMIFAFTLEVMLAFETLGSTIPSFSDKTWTWLEYINDLIAITPILEFGEFLQRTFHILEISLLLFGGFCVIIISEIAFILTLVGNSFSKEREITKDSTYFKVHAVVWYLGIIVAAIGYYIAAFILPEYSNFLDVTNWIKLLSILLAIYLVAKLIINCTLTTFWGPITATLISQMTLITSILITYFIAEPIQVENIQLEVFVLGISLGIVGIIFLLIATYTILERLESLLLYLWVGWAAIELIAAILGLIQEKDELIIVTVPLTILSLIITVIASRGKWWMTRAEAEEIPSGPPPQPPPSPLETELRSLTSAEAPPITPLTPPSTGPPPERPSPGPPPTEDSILSEKKKRRESMKKKMLDALDEF